MYTQCPNCLTIYEIQEDALQASLGIVRCGHCDQRFDALRTLSDTLPAGADTTLPERALEEHAPILTEAVLPAAIEAATRASPAASSAAEPSGLIAPSEDDQPTTVPADPSLFAPPLGERARALIADAAGIPPGAMDSEPAWQASDWTVQASFAELDVIPTTPWTADGPEAPPANPEPSVPGAESEPFTGSWSLDIPDTKKATEPAPAGQIPPEGMVHAGDFPTAADMAVETGASGLPANELVEALASEEPPAGQAAIDNARSVDGEAAATSSDGPSDFADAGALQSGSSDTEANTPVYVPPHRRGIRRSDALWAMGCLVLALVLAGQLVWAQRVGFVRDPATRTWAMWVCARLDCRLPPIRDIAKLELLSRDVRPDPDTAGALMITATLRNDAMFRQPWPVVVVELTDLDSDVVAMRRFRPAEYMPDPVRRRTGIAPGATAAVAFEVADPGRRAVAFRFSFE